MSECIIMNILNLEFYKSLGFLSKSDGVEFVNNNKKLKKEIEKKIELIEKNKYKIIENIKELFEDFEEQKEIYLNKLKIDKKIKINEKKELEKKLLKEQLKEEIKDEMLREKYKEVYPKFELIDIRNLSELFIEKLKSDKNINKIIELNKEAKDAIETLLRVRESLIKLN